jgi:hypothetical protein
MIPYLKLEKAILGAANPQEQNIIRKIVLGGSELLFMDAKNHKALFDDMMSGEGSVADKLGAGISHLMLILFDKSRPQSATPPIAPPIAQPQQPGLIAPQATTAPQTPAQPFKPQAPATMPKGALLPSSAILLTRAAEVIDKSSEPIDIATFNKALQVIAVKISARFDKGFVDKVKQRTGAPIQQEQPEQPVQTQPEQPAGLISPRGA